MPKSGKIMLGLFLFVAIIAFPIFYNMGNAKAAPPKINLNTPEINKLTSKECLEPAEYMRANHMQMLLDMRDSVVRDGVHTYTNSKGKTYEISLQNSCLKCHNESPAGTPIKQGDNQFCFSCHTYASVEPDCWSCHVDPRGAQK